MRAVEMASEARRKFVFGDACAFERHVGSVNYDRVVCGLRIDEVTELQGGLSIFHLAIVTTRVTRLHGCVTPTIVDELEKSAAEE